jgi:hypothetical protein
VTESDIHRDAGGIMMQPHYDARMRTTIDLPDDLHQLTTAVARSRHQTLSQTIAEILRRSLLTDVEERIGRDETTGLPVVRLGRPITAEDVSRAEDDE